MTNQIIKLGCARPVPQGCEWGECDATATESVQYPDNRPKAWLKTLNCCDACAKVARAEADEMRQGEDTVPCNRCDNDLTPDMIRWMDESAPKECSKCGCEFEDPTPEWMEAQGYDEVLP